MPRLSELQLQLGLSHLATTRAGLRTLARTAWKGGPGVARPATRGWAGPVRPLVLGTGVLPSAIDLVARLQQLGGLQQLALAATVVAALAALLGTLRLPRRLPAAGGALLFGLSAAVRLSGHAEGPAFALAGLATFGLGGLFATAPRDEAEPSPAPSAAAPTPARLPQSV